VAKSVEFTFEALATKWWLQSWDKSLGDNLNYVEDLFKQANIIANTFENQYSRFLPNSFITKLNTDRTLNNFPKELFEIINFAENIREKSNGLFNVAVGGILENLGYDKDYSFRQKKELNSSFDTYQSSFEILDPEQIKLKDGVKIDLGGIGKGWLIDKIAKYFLESGLNYFSINGGGDIYATSDNDSDVEFILEHPIDFSQKIGSICIKNQGLACSASNRRVWTDLKTGETFHHLINLNNLQSSEGKLAVFTQAKNALLADVMSTTLFIAKNSEIESLAKKIGVEFLIIFPDLSYVKSLGYSGVLFDS
jgi:thiamine biosynthesis lipoprotein